MENFIIENNKDELIFKLKKSDFDSNFIISLIKNLETKVSLEGRDLMNL